MSAVGVQRVFPYPGTQYGIDTYFAPEHISIGALGNLDTNGVLLAALPPRTQIAVTPRAKGVAPGTGTYWIIVNSQPCQLISECLARTGAPFDTGTTNI